MTESSQAAAPQSSEASLNDEVIVDLMQRLEKTADNAYCCEEVFALLDEYVEQVADNDEAKRLMPLVRNHLDVCAGCREEYEILLHILKTAESE